MRTSRVALHLGAISHALQTLPQGGVQREREQAIGRLERVEWAVAALVRTTPGAFSRVRRGLGL